jgi:hypothetical protein
MRERNLHDYIANLFIPLFPCGGGRRKKGKTTVAMGFGPFLCFEGEARVSGLDTMSHAPLNLHFFFPFH